MRIMMKKRLLAILLTCSMLLTLCGCGSASSTGPASLAPTPDPVPASTPTVSTPPESAPESVPAESVPEEPEVEEKEELIAYAFYANGNDCEIYSIDPETGEYYKVLRFDGAFPLNTATGDALARYGRYLPRLIFNGDYTKMGVTRWDEADRLEHAGWLDENSEFHDVQVLLFGPPDDFADPVAYEALGFTPDGLFVYREKDHPDMVYYVDSNNPTERFEGDPITEQYLRGMVDLSRLYGGFVFNDWVDDDKFIATTNDDMDISQLYSGSGQKSYPVIMSVSDPGYRETFIPDSERSNYGGVISPDGANVAFASIDSSGRPSLFIVPRDGSAPPQKIFEPTNKFWLELLEWR